MFTDSFLDFMWHVYHTKLDDIYSVSALCKDFGIPVPTSLEKGTLREATSADKQGKTKFTISTSKFGWLFPWLAKTKCVLICTEFAEGIHCLHVCITCLDDWPGPGCYIHGSWE